MDAIKEHYDGDPERYQVARDRINEALYASNDPYRIAEQWLDATEPKERESGQGQTS
jgi:hypothetical protein